MQESQPFDKETRKRKMRNVMVNNFVGGIFWALGVTIGFSLFVAGLTLLSGYIDLVPFVGIFLSDILDFILSYNQNIR